MRGQGEDLGGGVFKKRLNDNLHRGIILAKGGRHWVYSYLFAKSDRENIQPNELADFRLLADAYSKLSDQQVDELVLNKDWIEICRDEKTQI